MKKLVILLVLGLFLVTGCSKEESLRLESISMKQVHDISENIEEYPDYEYIAGYYAWDGVIYKKDETD